MNHFEKKYSHLSLVLIGFMVSGCSSSFSPSTTGSGMQAAAGLGSGNAKTTALPSAASISAAISAGLAVANSLQSNASFGPCTGSGPSSQVLTDVVTNSSYSLSSQTTLTFSGASCNILNSDEITLSPQITVSDSNGDGVQVSSAMTNNYLGKPVGGGVVIDYSLSTPSASINVLGLHVVTTGSESADISVSSPTPITAALSLSSPNFSLTSSGSFEIDDNTDQLSLLLGSTGLVWNQSCGCPVGGTLTGMVSGSQTGSITVTYGSTCGAMTITANGSTSSTTVSQCQP